MLRFPQQSSMILDMETLPIRLPIIGRERALIDGLSRALQAHIGGPPPSRAKAAELRRHNSAAVRQTDFGNRFEVQVVDPDGEPTGHIALVTIEVVRFERP